MNIKKNITINLSEDDVKEIITEYCIKNGYDVITEDVNLLVCKRSVGYGPMEHDEWFFAGAKVNVKEK